VLGPRWSNRGSRRASPHSREANRTRRENGGSESPGHVGGEHGGTPVSWKRGNLGNAASPVLGCRNGEEVLVELWAEQLG